MSNKGPMLSNGLMRRNGSFYLLITALVASLAVGGCRSRRGDEVRQSSPEIIYQTARQRLNQYDYNTAIKTYEALTARFPFTDQARQARLDLIYAYYRAGESESAIDAAETFIRENPTHPRVDYAWYIRGLVDFERTPNVVERFFRVDLTERPPTTARKAFGAFRTVVEQYPKSEYAHDSRLRMIYLRNRLADYELNVARYYFKRGAYVAAAQRAKNTIEQFDGAPAIREALQVMVKAYDKMGLEELANQTRQVYLANFADDLQQTAQNKPWWKVW
jgi:outer membrane protein assembly factor BamD